MATIFFKICVHVQLKGENGHFKGNEQKHFEAIFCGRFNFTRLTYTVVYSNREGCSQNYCVFAAIKENE